MNEAHEEIMDGLIGVAAEFTRSDWERIRNALDFRRLKMRQQFGGRLIDPKTKKALREEIEHLKELASSVEEATGIEKLRRD